MTRFFNDLSFRNLTFNFFTFNLTCVNYIVNMNFFFVFVCSNSCHQWTLLYRYILYKFLDLFLKFLK